jgi:hypothetical protein
MEGLPSGGAVLDDDHGRGRGNRACTPGHGRVILRRAQHGLTGIEALELRRAEQALPEHRRDGLPRGSRRSVEDQLRPHAGDDLERRLHADEPWLDGEHALDTLGHGAIMPIRLQAVGRSRRVQR